MIMKQPTSPNTAAAAAAAAHGVHAANVVDYGYGKAEPDSAAVAVVDYGYGDAAPDSHHHSNSSSNNNSSNTTKPAFDPRRVPRRSSLKSNGSFSSSSPGGDNRPRRRASISTTEMMEVDLPGKGGRVVRRRSITFNTQTRVRQVEPTKSLARHPDQLWFQDHEYDEIRNNIMAQVTAQGLLNAASSIKDKRKNKKVVDRSVDDDDDKSRVGFKRWSSNKKKQQQQAAGQPHQDNVKEQTPTSTMRGLEKLLSPDEMTVKKAQAMDCVLNEQYLQRRGGDFNDEHIALIYKYSTMRSSVEATERAQLDSQEAEEYCDRDLPTEYRPYALRARMSRRMSM
jgi:hypothetical protein